MPRSTNSSQCSLVTERDDRNTKHQRALFSAERYLADSVNLILLIRRLSIVISYSRRFAIITGGRKMPHRERCLYAKPDIVGMPASFEHERLQRQFAYCNEEMPLCYRAYDPKFFAVKL